VNRRDPVSTSTGAEMQVDVVHESRDSHRFQPPTGRAAE
jgi:hypothetical protein